MLQGVGLLATDPYYEGLRRVFFNFIYGGDAAVEYLANDDAYICVARRPAESKDFEEEFFQYPQELDRLLDHVERFCLNHDMWYSTQLFSRKRRKKEYALACPSAWSDLDGCAPNKLQVEPSITVESSPGRHQAIWRFKEPLPPLDAEQISKRIAYYHKEDGADVSGWDLTQILRIPYTHNFKYGGIGIAPLVSVAKTNGEDYDPGDFDCYPPLKEDLASELPLPLPEVVPSQAEVMFSRRHDLHPLAYTLINSEPQEDWSGTMWKLINLLFECDLTHEEVFGICLDAKCNKYERDSRSNKYALLWKEVCRAYTNNQERLESKLPTRSHHSLQLVTDDERAELNERLSKEPTFIENYIEWASGLGDAAPQYHQAGAFVALSAVIAGSVRLPTSFGTIMPNLWFMLLGNTTLTRKTTAMDVAIDLINEINDQAVVATDGSIEGLFSSMALRPGVPSIFLRDEFSGLLEGMIKKDYMAGMAEMLTKLYDGKYQKRVLRKETIEVREPVLVLFTGGIKNRIYELLTYDQVTSGFLPRFIFITAEADLTKIKPVGPPTITGTSKKSALMFQMKDLFDHYNKIEVTQGTVIKHRFNAELTPDAWARYNRLETSMLAHAMDSQHHQLLTPTFDRMAKSGLKAALLIAASRQKVKPVVIEEYDLIHAFSYVENWLGYSLEVVQNIGKTSYEKTLDNIVEAVRREPGILRGTIMKMFQLNSRTADDMLTTLDERGLLRGIKSGKSIRLEIPSG